MVGIARLNASIDKDAADLVQAELVREKT